MTTTTNPIPIPIPSHNTHANTLLFTELHRVATAPYTVSLKLLLDALTTPPTTPSTATVTLWSTSHPCLLPPLSTAVLTALEFCPSAERVLQLLCKDRLIRDAVLRAKRTFLDSMLKSAAGGGGDRHFHRYSPLVLSLLSHPLPPSSLPPPASLAPFFLRIVETATLFPTPEAVRNVYTLISSTSDISSGSGGGGVPLGAWLSRENYAMLVAQLTKFLRNTQQAAVLAALAALARFHVIEGAGGGEVGAGTGAGGEGKEGDGGEVIALAQANEFFSVKKAEKVLGLVCFNVITCLTAGGGGSEDGTAVASWEERIEQVEYANVILGAVGEEAKARYLDGEGRKGKGVVENLVGKMRRLVFEGEEAGVGGIGMGMDEVKGRLVREAVKFVVGLVGPAVGRFASVGEFVEKLVVVGRGLPGEQLTTTTIMVDGETLAALFAANPTSPTPPPSLPTLLRTAFHLSTTPLPLSPSSFTHLQDSTALLSALAKSPVLGRAVLAVIAAPQFKGVLEAFLHAGLPAPGGVSWDCAHEGAGAGGGACPFALARMQRELVGGICTLVLMHGIYGVSETNNNSNEDPRPNSNSLQPSTFTALLALYRRLYTPLPLPPTTGTTTGSTTTQLTCPYETLPHPPPSPPLPLLQTSSTPGTTLTSHNWRLKLADTLSRDALRQHTQLISSLGEVCRDLEARCATIEAPLQEERARSQALSRDLLATQGTAEALRAELERVEAEKEGLEVQVDAAVEKVREVEGEMGELRRGLDGARREVREAREERERLAGEHLCEMAERGGRIAALEGEVRRVKGELDGEREEGRRLGGELEGLRAAMGEREGVVRGLRGKVGELERCLEEGLVERDRLVEERDDVIAGLNVEVGELRRKAGELEECLEDGMKERDRLVEEKNDHIAGLNVEVGELRNQLGSRDGEILALEEKVVELSRTIEDLTKITARLKREYDETHQQLDKRSREVERLGWEVAKQRKEGELTQEKWQTKAGEWNREKGELLAQIRAWEGRFDSQRALQLRKEKEAQEAQGLARKLFALYQGGGQRVGGGSGGGGGGGGGRNVGARGGRGQEVGVGRAAGARARSRSKSMPLHERVDPGARKEYAEQEGEEEDEEEEYEDEGEGMDESSNSTTEHDQSPPPAAPPPPQQRLKRKSAMAPTPAAHPHRKKLKSAMGTTREGEWGREGYGDDDDDDGDGEEWVAERVTLGVRKSDIGGRGKGVVVGGGGLYSGSGKPRKDIRPGSVGGGGGGAAGGRGGKGGKVLTSREDKGKGKKPEPEHDQFDQDFEEVEKENISPAWAGGAAAPREDKYPRYLGGGGQTDDTDVDVLDADGYDNGLDSGEETDYLLGEDSVVFTSTPKGALGVNVAMGGLGGETTRAEDEEGPGVGVGV